MEKNILIAEDNEQMRKLIEKVISDAGYKTIVAKDGEDAFIKFQQNENLINLVISDIRMPGINGKEFYRKVKSIKPEIKFIFISSFDNDIADFLLNENLDFLQKPFRIKELLEKVAQFLKD